jgi:hypothetical protein
MPSFATTDNCALYRPGMFPRGTRVTVPNPDGEGRIAAEFQAVDPSRPGEVSDPRVVRGTRPVDQAWVVYAEGELEGTTGLVDCAKIRSAD